MCITVPCREKMADHVTASNIRASGVPGWCVTDLSIHGELLAALAETEVHLSVLCRQISGQSPY